MTAGLLFGYGGHLPKPFLLQPLQRVVSNFQQRFSGRQRALVSRCSGPSPCRVQVRDYIAVQRAAAFRFDAASPSGRGTFAWLSTALMSCGTLVTALEIMAAGEFPALAIAANTSIFNPINGVLLRLRPHPNSDRLLEPLARGWIPRFHFERSIQLN